MRIGIKEEDKEYYKRPGSYVIIEREEDNKIAVVTNGIGYFFLGGGLEENETNEEALRRELIEESGYTLKDVKYFDIVTTYIYNEKKGYMDIDATIYIAKFDKKVSEPIEKDHKIIWVNPLEYKDKLYREYQRYILNKYVSKKKLVINNENRNRYR